MNVKIFIDFFSPRCGSDFAACCNAKNGMTKLHDKRERFPLPLAWWQESQQEDQ